MIIHLRKLEGGIFSLVKDQELNLSLTTTQYSMVASGNMDNVRL